MLQKLLVTYPGTVVGSSDTRYYMLKLLGADSVTGDKGVYI
jgi:hypothetical protein